MNPPPFEVADMICTAGKSFVEKNRSRLTWQHLRVLRAIERCRTAALGGHLDQCSRCGYQAISYNSCRNPHGAKCQTNARVTSGSPPVKRNCLLGPMCTLSSRCHISFRISPFPTRSRV